MPRKNDKGTGSKILRIFWLVPTVLSLFGNLVAMMHAETALMRKRIMMIVVLALFLLVLMMNVWICVNALLYVYLISLGLGTNLSLVLILSLNFLFFVITCLVIALLRVDPTFPETRKALQEMISK